MAAVTALHDVVDHSAELAGFGLEDQVALVQTGQRAVGGNGDHLEAVDACQFGRFGLSRSGHAGQLVVEAKVVLEGDRRECLVLLLDRHPLLGFHGLVDAVRPAPALEYSAGELVDDPDLAIHDDVVLVAFVELLGFQRRMELVDKVGRHLVVEVVDTEGGLDGVHSGLGGSDDSLLLVDLVVALGVQPLNHGGEPLVERRRLG